MPGEYLLVSHNLNRRNVPSDPAMGKFYTLCLHVVGSQYTPQQMETDAGCNSPLSFCVSMLKGLTPLADRLSTKTFVP